MGYSYGRTSTGRMALACQDCPTVGGVRKRTCPHKVRSDTLHSPTRIVMAYCPAPALCANCWAKHGPASKLHARCAEPAATSQAEYDAVQTRLDAGEWGLVSASGAGVYNPDIPEGMVRVTFWRSGGPANGERQILVPSGEYDPSSKRWLVDYPQGVAPRG